MRIAECLKIGIAGTKSVEYKLFNCLKLFNISFIKCLRYLLLSILQSSFLGIFPQVSCKITIF